MERSGRAVSDAVAVTLGRSSWLTVYGLALEMAVRLTNEGEYDDARRVLEEIVPKLAEAGDAGDVLRALEQVAREDLEAAVAVAV